MKQMRIQVTERPLTDDFVDLKIELLLSYWQVHFCGPALERLSLVLDEFPIDINEVAFDADDDFYAEQPRAVTELDLIEQTRLDQVQEFLALVIHYP